MPVTLAEAEEVRAQLLAQHRAGKPVTSIQEVLPAERLTDYLKESFEVFKALPTLIEVQVPDPSARVIVVGDTHGQFHDVCKMFETFGLPSERNIYVFNGDYVDRGAWGVEVFVFLVLLKLALPPGCIHLLRGNHESSTCTRFYGFLGELQAKYGASAKGLYQLFKRNFANLPLGALIQGKTLVLHGGLFRHMPDNPRSSRKRKYPPKHVTVGSLDDLRAACKGGLDPDGYGSSILATDVLWSDPVARPGLETNDARGVGLVFGPDVTQAFLESNQLRLIIRSHEGPDARDRRDDLPQILSGYSFDHRTPAGDLLTVFSAPDYPQFQDSEERYHNLGAVAILTAPDYCVPDCQTFEAYQPRPQAEAYYDYMTHAMSDDELPGGDGGSTLSEGSTLSGTSMDHDATAETAETTVGNNDATTGLSAAAGANGAGAGANHASPTGQCNGAVDASTEGAAASTPAVGVATMVVAVAGGSVLPSPGGANGGGSSTGRDAGALQGVPIEAMIGSELPTIAVGDAAGGTGGSGKAMTGSELSTIAPGSSNTPDPGVNTPGHEVDGSCNSGSGSGDDAEGQLPHKRPRVDDGDCDGVGGISNGAGGIGNGNCDGNDHASSGGGGGGISDGGGGVGNGTGNGNIHANGAG